MSISQCQVCGEVKETAVCAVPGIPFSAAYCQECFDANAHPYDLVVTNTYISGGYDKCVDWWQEIVDDTLNHLKIPRGQFNEDVGDEADVTVSWEAFKENDPVEYEDGKGWFFWDETWAEQCGFYETQKEATEACLEYAKEVLGTTVEDEPMSWVNHAHKLLKSWRSSVFGR